MSLKIVILAAGKGTRMRSKLPKVLQPLANKPLLHHVLSTAKQLTNEILTIVGHEAELVSSTLKADEGKTLLQAEQLGTGHAVKQALTEVRPDDQVLVLYGDVPLIRKETLEDLCSLMDEQHPVALLTITLANSTGYGRIIRNHHNQVEAIVEEKEASLAQKEIKEVNTGIMAVRGRELTQWLNNLSSDNAQQEYYLTDIIEMAVADGYHIRTTQPEFEIEVLGVNDKIQLQYLERQYQGLLAHALMQKGATLVDASRMDIRGSLTIEQDVFIDVNTLFEGEVHLGENVKVGANCVIKNTFIAANTVIEPFSHLEGAKIGEACHIGPYARLRPGTDLSNQVKVGNFVETKNAKIAQGSKMSHLSYIGDTVMGAECNIGAGTITCNYDGVNKFTTEIGNHVFVGSDTQLIAPVKIGDGATIGAGSTITKDSPENELTLSRSKQITIKGWQKPQKIKK